MHKKCERWASLRGAVFAPAKSELIHLSRNSKKFNMAASINTETTVIKLKADIRVLGLQVEIKLKWGSGVRKTPEKKNKQSMALTKTPNSIGGAIFFESRRCTPR